MTSNPLVSIITPSYNQAAFIEDTLQSVLAQDYEPIEYLIVDGASNDGSADVIADYARRAPERIRWWVSEPDSGQAEAINKGLQRAGGEFVAWLNSDDIYLPGAVWQAVAALQSRPKAGLVFADAITIDAQGRPINRLTFHTNRGWDLAELMRFHIICQPAVFMRRDVLQRAGLLDAGYHFMLDHHLWLRMARHGQVVYANNDLGTNGLWAAARHHPTAKNVARPKDFGDETLKILDWFQQDPFYRSMMDVDRRRVLGGAYRLTARYMLDGGLPAAALKTYLRAFFLWPQYTARHWHRMFYALLGSLGLNRTIRWFDRKRSQKSMALTNHLSSELNKQIGQYIRRNPDRTGKFDREISSQTSGTDPGVWPGLWLDPLEH